MEDAIQRDLVGGGGCYIEGPSRRWRMLYRGTWYEVEDAIQRDLVGGGRCYIEGPGRRWRMLYRGI